MRILPACLLVPLAFVFGTEDSKIVQAKVKISSHLTSLSGAACDSSNSARVLLNNKKTQKHHSHLSKLRELHVSLNKELSDYNDEISLLEKNHLLISNQQRGLKKQKKISPESKTTVSLKAEILQDRQLSTYYGDMNVGGQIFKMLFDTGSCEVWIPSSDCYQYSPHDICDKHSKYNVADSATSLRFKEDQVMSVEYLSGKIEGPLVYDNVNIGSMSISKQPLCTADTIDVPLLADVVWDGVLGLSYPNDDLYQAGVIPVMDTMIERKMLKDNVISYYISDRGGVITFGGVDSSLIHVDHRKRQFLEMDESEKKLNKEFSSDELNAIPFVYAKVVEKTYWTIDIIDVEMKYKNQEKGQSVYAESKVVRAIVDTGTYLTYYPEPLVEESPFAKLNLNSCSDIENLPEITFVIFSGEDKEPIRVTLQPIDYTLDFHTPLFSSPAQTDCLNAANRDTLCQSACVVGLAPDNTKEWTLGQSFMQAYYTVFDRDNHRIGFVRSNPNVDLS